MVTFYAIEKQVRGKWVPAWGVSPRSFPHAESDAEAVEIFQRETARVRSPYKLTRVVVEGYPIKQTIIATAGPPPRNG